MNPLKLSAFENIAAVSVLRPDSLYRAIVAFVDDILGKFLFHLGVCSMSKGLEQCKNYIPLRSKLFMALGILSF